ncbi:MAG: PLDc N-terminal domain-containing protein [Clostridia bacterium]|nr:PLDc N-terminal domain-containing protein [Clostridia bacterium]
MKKLSERKKRRIERTVANNRSYKLYLYNRFLSFLLLVLGQLVGFAFLTYLFIYNTKIGVMVQLAVGVLSFLVVLYLISESERPSIKLNWILLIVVVPIVGVPSYLLYGEGRPTRWMKRRMEKSTEENNRQFAAFYGLDPLTLPQSRNHSTAYYLAKYGAYPIYNEGKVTYYKSGEEMFAAMKEGLNSAEKFILLDYFIIAHGKMWKEILTILMEKAELGVQIRIIYDDFGCMMTLPPKYDRYLEGLHKNIRCMTFNDVIPVFAVHMNNRDHRKIMVIDGKIAFTGGVNLADEYIGEKVRFGYWKDTGIRIEGAAVASFTKMFFDVWNAFRVDKEGLENYLLPAKEGTMYASNGENGLILQPYDDSPLDKVSAGESVYLDVIQRACRYVYIFTPYLVLDDHMRAVLMQAATRGVDVRIVTPGVPDKKITYRLTRANYEMLMKAGVKIYEYTPGFIHAKSVVSDDTCAVVGTINFDYRSLYHHFENAVYFANCDEVLAVKRDAEETFAVSKLCTEKDLRRTLVGRFFDSILRVFETLF